MGEISIVHGIILLKDADSFQQIIHKSKRDEHYPWIRPEMFSMGATESPYFYENQVVSFAATYKNLDGGVSWSEFMLKFEHILTQTDFRFAQIRLMTEFMGNYEFFWGKKTGGPYETYKKSDLIECEQWYFGYGFRGIFGHLVFQPEKALPFNFQYPIVEAITIPPTHLIFAIPWPLTA